MISGLLTPHWASKRFTRHWQAINISLSSFSHSLGRKLFSSPPLESIEAPSTSITRRAAEARKVLDEVFGYEANLLEPLKAIDSFVDAELVYDVISRIQIGTKSLDDLKSIWEQARGPFSGEDRYFVELPARQNAVISKSKIFFLANLCVEMLQYLLQYLLQFSFQNDGHLRYWEERELEYKNWYWIETTPYFWFRYILQKNQIWVPTVPRIHPKRSMRAKLKVLRELRSSIAESVGRLTAQLNAFRQVKRIVEAQIEIEETFVQCKIALELFNEKPEGEDIVQEEPAKPEPKPRKPMERYNSQAQIISNEWFTKTYTQLGETTQLYENLFVSLTARLKTVKEPNWYSTHWMQFGVGAIVLYFAGKSIYESRHSIVQYINDTKLAIVRFWQEHLKDPIKNIWDVIRYDKTTLSVVDEVSLKQDLESLGRMVADFAKDTNKNFTEADLAVIMDAAQRGDLSNVLRAYEQNIKSPIRSVITGDLIRLVLIQVQKQKVDLEKAMEALDQLLRANELNFQFLATIPAVLLIGGVAYQLRNLFYSRTPNKVLYASIHSDMRNLERMLNTKAISRSAADSVPVVGRIGDLSYEAYGLLLHITTRLQYMADRLAGRNKVWFEEDLKEIESEKTDATQKLSTIQRMYHTYAFLQQNK